MDKSYADEGNEVPVSTICFSIFCSLVGKGEEQTPGTLAHTDPQNALGGRWWWSPLKPKPAQGGPAQDILAQNHMARSPVSMGVEFPLPRGEGNNLDVNNPSLVGSAPWWLA